MYCINELYFLYKYNKNIKVLYNIIHFYDFIIFFGKSFN